MDLPDYIISGNNFIFYLSLFRTGTNIDNKDKTTILTPFN